MSAFPPEGWSFPLRPELITSEEAVDRLRYQEELVGRISEVSSEISDAIYGEKSKWLPVAQGASTAGTGTYEVQVGHYVRWGSMVWFTLNLQWDDANHTGTGNLEITGLPVSAHENSKYKTITGITQANPGVVTTAQNHGFINGDTVLIESVVGMTEVNGNTYTVANKTNTTFELSGVDTTSFTAYSSGGKVRLTKSLDKVVCPCYNAESGSEFVGIAFINPGENKISVIKNGATTQQINGADYDLQITGTYRAL